MPQLTGKAAIVTGGSKGIGKAIARAFLDAGADVIIAARNQSDLHAATGELAAAGGRIESIRADVSQEADVKRIFARASDLFGRVDILVNNAGFGVVAPLRELDTAVWESVIATNLTGTFLLYPRGAQADDPAKIGPDHQYREHLVSAGSPKLGALRPPPNSGLWASPTPPPWKEENTA